MALKKKIAAIIAAIATTSALGINAMAAGKPSAVFYVDDAWVFGFVQYFDSTGGNPFDSDIVRAITESEEYMDKMTSVATLYYTQGCANKHITENAEENYTKKCSVDAKKYTFAKGYKGVGNRTAKRNKSGDVSDSTVIEW